MTGKAKVPAAVRSDRDRERQAGVAAFVVDDITADASYAAWNRLTLGCACPSCKAPEGERCSIKRPDRKRPGARFHRPRIDRAWNALLREAKSFACTNCGSTAYPRIWGALLLCPECVPHAALPPRPNRDAGQLGFTFDEPDGEPVPDAPRAPRTPEPTGDEHADAVALVRALLGATPIL